MKGKAPLCMEDLTPAEYARLSGLFRVIYRINKRRRMAAAAVSARDDGNTLK